MGDVLKLAEFAYLSVIIHNIVAPKNTIKGITILHCILLVAYSYTVKNQLFSIYRMKAGQAHARNFNFVLQSYTWTKIGLNLELRLRMFE